MAEQVLGVIIKFINSYKVTANCGEILLPNGHDA